MQPDKGQSKNRTTTTFHLKLSSKRSFHPPKVKLNFHFRICRQPNRRRNKTNSQGETTPLLRRRSPLQMKSELRKENSNIKCWRKSWKKKKKGGMICVRSKLGRSSFTGNKLKKSRSRFYSRKRKRSSTTSWIKSSKKIGGIRSWLKPANKLLRTDKKWKRESRPDLTNQIRNV